MNVPVNIAVDLSEYGELCIAMGLSSRLKIKRCKSTKWNHLILRHRKLKTMLATHLRQIIPREHFAAAFCKTMPTHPVAKLAHNLLHYDPSSFLASVYPTREALLYAVYKAHATERSKNSPLKKNFERLCAVKK